MAVPPVEKSIRSREKRIAEHLDKLPIREKCLRPELTDEGVKRYTEAHWPKEIQRFQDEIDIAKQ